MFGQFHFIRPWWFIALIPAISIILLKYKNINAAKNNWTKYCDPHLLKDLLSSYTEKSSLWLPGVILVSWLLIILALAGPTWSHYPTPVYQKHIARVIALDVSQSMDANDLSPSRLQRAKYKTLDLLNVIKEGQTGMIVFSSLPFIVSPLTNDTNTIANMVPVLSSDIVPVQGSDIEKALSKSAQLLKGAGYTQGQIILITDSYPTNDAIQEAKALAKQGYITSVLGIGNSNSLDVNTLEQLAKAGGSEYIQFNSRNSDIEELLSNYNANGLINESSKETQMENLWKDEGVYLIWIAMLLIAFIARKGWLEKIC